MSQVSIPSRVHASRMVCPYISNIAIYSKMYFCCFELNTFLRVVYVLYVGSRSLMTIYGFAQIKYINAIF